MNWMNCNTCRRCVRQNETGICLACQSGFTGSMAPDDYFMQKPQEVSYAIEERLQQKNNQREYQERDDCWETAETSNSYSALNCS